MLTSPPAWGGIRLKSLPGRLLAVAILALLLVGCSTDAQTSSTTPQASATGSTTGTGTSSHLGIAALDGWQVSLFVTGTATIFNPDSVIVEGGHVFVDYQNDAAKDGSDTKKSTIVEYSMDGKVVNTFSAPGHSDGMRMDPATKLLWVTSNEDANAKFETIDPASGTVTPYTFPAAPHGGGYDDVYFLNGLAFIAASNPNLDKNGVNVFPALDTVTLANGNVTLKPILMGNASALDTSTLPPSQVTLNEVDPDSLATDGKGNLILINQGGSEIVTLSNPGTPQQKVTRLPVGTQLDDTVWATSTKGRLLITDAVGNRTIWLTPPKITIGTIYTQTPDDSGVVGMIGVVDPKTGLISPVAIGLNKPTGMVFVPDSQ